MTLKGLEVRGFLGKVEKMACMEVLNPEDAHYYKFCKITKLNLLNLKLDGIRFESARNLSIFLDDLNSKLLQSLDIKKLLWNPTDFTNLEHLYSVLGRFTSLRTLSLPILEHSSVPSPTFSRLLSRLPHLRSFTFSLRAPAKLPS